MKRKMKFGDGTLLVVESITYTTVFCRTFIKIKITNKKLSSSSKNFLDAKK